MIGNTNKANITKPVINDPVSIIAFFKIYTFEN